MIETFVNQREVESERRKRINAELIQPIIGGLIGGVIVLAIAAIVEVVRYG